jgi:hypothetical protein
MEDEHKEAIESLAAERYMLDEMTDAERESFEDHYFNCRFCSEDVRAIDLMRRTGAAIGRRKKVAPKRLAMVVAPWTIAASLATALTWPQRSRGRRW